MHILCLISVGSVLHTIHLIEKELRNEVPELTMTLLDFVGFRQWNATAMPYHGIARRIRITPADWTIESWNPNDTLITQQQWHSFQRGAAQLIVRIQPDLLFTVDDADFVEWAILQAADSAGIPSLMVQDGPRDDLLPDTRPFFRRMKIWVKEQMLTFERNRLVDAPKICYPRYGAGGAHYIASVSDFYTAGFKKRARGSTKHIITTGMPRFDPLYAARQRFKHRRQKRCASDSLRIIVIALPFIKYDHTISHRENFRLCQKMTMTLNLLLQKYPLHITIRLHPSSDHEDIHAYTTNLACTPEVQCPDKPVGDVLPDYDFVLGFASTVLLEAMAIGIPVVCVHSTDKIGCFEGRVSLPCADTPDTLYKLCVQEIERGQIDPQRQDILNELGQIDGQASYRVARLCQNIVQKSKR